jgi:zinc protease
VALVALLAALPPGRLAAQSAPIQVPATVDTLPNGLRLIIHQDPSAPVVTVNVWYHVGSGDEKPGRTGFAHLFEHLMFMGSEHAPYPEFDRRLEAVGANNNGSTTEDRTNYYEWGPANALPLMLWLEADRMGWMLPTMDSAKVDLQRDVVKNERRQSYENQPYGMVGDHLPRMLYPSGHPYSWTVIGSMADLSAASLEDVKQFFREYYAPNNAVLAVAGAVDPALVRRLVGEYFGAIPRGPAIRRPAPARPAWSRDTALVLEDRVGLARLYYAFPTVKAWEADDAALSVAAYLLTGARNARLTKRLVYDEQLVSGVSAFQGGQKLAGDFSIVATAKPNGALPAIQRVIDEELRRLATDGPTERELQQARNALEASFLGGIERVQSKANQLNSYYFELGTPDGFQRDLDRYRSVTAEQVRTAVRRYLTGTRAIVSVVPQGKRELAATAREVTP